MKTIGVPHKHKNCRSSNAPPETTSLYRLQNKMRRVGLGYVRSQTDQRKPNTRNKVTTKKQNFVRRVTQRDREGGKNVGRRFTVVTSC